MLARAFSPELFLRANKEVPGLHLNIPAINPEWAAGPCQPFGCFEYILRIIANLIAINKIANNIIIFVCLCLNRCTHVKCKGAHGSKREPTRVRASGQTRPCAAHAPRIGPVKIIDSFWAIPGGKNQI